MSLNPTANPSTSPLRKWIFLSVLYGVLLAYFYSFMEYGFNIWDEGGFANGTLRTLNGEKALVDFNPNGYLPGRYWYGALFFKLFGVEILSLRLSVILFTPAMIMMTYAIAKKIMPPGFALLAALFMLSAPGMYYNRFYPFLCILNLFCLLRVLQRKRLFSVLLLAGAILLSALVKFEVALFTVVICLAMVLAVVLHPGWRRQFSVMFPSALLANSSNNGQTLSKGILAALALSSLALIFYFLQNDFFQKVFHLVIDAHRVWGNPFPTLFPFVQLLKEIGLQGMFERLLFYLPILIYVIIGIILLVSLLKKKNDPEQTDLALLAILAFGICAFGLVIWRAGFDNLLRTLAPAYILFCYILHLVRQNVLRTKFFNSSGNGVMDGIKKLGVNVLTVFLPFLFFYEMNVHHGFYAGTVGAKTIETAKVALPRMQVFTNPEEAEWIAAVVDRVETYSNKGDAILALPLNPIFYFLTDRVNPTPYDWVLPGMLDEHAEKQMVALLERNKPKVIVFVDIAIDGKEERRLPNYAPEVYEFISEHYVFEEFIGIFQILLPKSRLE